MLQVMLPSLLHTAPRKVSLCVCGNHLTSCSFLAEVVQLRQLPHAVCQHAQYDQDGHHEQHEQCWERFQQAGNKSQALEPEGAACGINALPRAKQFSCLTWHRTAANAGCISDLLWVKYTGARVFW